MAETDVRLQVPAEAEPVPDDGAPPAGDDRNAAAAAAVATAAGAGGPAPAAPAPNPEAEYLAKMRGWLMTVATLFVGIAFQVMMHPPDWMPKDPFRATVAPRRGESKTKYYHDLYLYIKDELRGAHDTTFCFHMSNTISFGMGLALVVTLLVTKNDPSKSDMMRITGMVVMLAMSVACTFVCGVSSDALAVLLTLVTLAMYAVGTFVALEFFIRATTFRNWFISRFRPRRTV